VPIQFEIDHAERFVRARAYGVVRLAEILDYFDALVLQDAMPYPKLFDAREAEPDLSDDDVMILGARVSAYAVLEPRGPVAAVAVTKQASDILQRFMNLGAPRRPMRLFTSVEEAHAWLLSSS
jgi:hypothetical protein